MDLIHFRIHPSVGMARFGESKEWYFLGPQFPRFMQDQFPHLRHKSVAIRHPAAPSGPEPAKPADGVFRDAAGHVMPQAARFRVFAYMFNVGSREPYKVVEMTTNDVDIEWKVAVANRKTVRTSGVVDVNDPDEVTLSTSAATGPQHCKKPGNFPSLARGVLEDGTGRLHVIGNEGIDFNDQPSPPTKAPRLYQLDWFDTAADGHVNAVVTPKAAFLSRFAGYKYLVPGQKDPQPLAAGGSIAALGAWVVINMPDYVPDMGHFVSLWDVALGQSWKQVADGAVKPVDGRHFLATAAAEINDYAFYDYHTHIHPVLALFGDVNYTSGQTRNANAEDQEHSIGIVIRGTLAADADDATSTLTTSASTAFRLQAAALMDPAQATRTFTDFHIVLTPVAGKRFAPGHELVLCTDIADDGTLTVARGVSGTGPAPWASGTAFFAAPKGTFQEIKLKVDASAAATVLEVKPSDAHRLRQPTGVANDLNEGPFFIALADSLDHEWVKCVKNDKRAGKLTVQRHQFGTVARDWDADTTLICTGGGHKTYDARKHMTALATGARGPAHKRIYERLRLPRTVYDRKYKTLDRTGETPFPREFGRRFNITGPNGIDTVSGDPDDDNTMVPDAVLADPGGTLAGLWHDPRVAGNVGKACKGSDYGTGDTDLERLDDAYWIVSERDMPMLIEYAVTQLQFDQFGYWATAKKRSGSKLRWAPLFTVLFQGTAIGAFLRSAGHSAEEYFQEFARRLPRYTPAMLDMANLGKMFGGSFWPGIEIGLEGGKAANWSLVHGATKYFPDLRFHPVTGTTPHQVGMLTKDLAVPWFNDFIACTETFWPTSRPQVVYQEQGFAYQWLNGVSDITDYWRKVGFIRRESDALIEKERLLALD